MKVKEIVKMTVDELLDAGRIKYDTEMAYHFINVKLAEYYSGGSESKAEFDRLSEAIEKIKDDEYSNVLRLYYREGHTIEEIADILDRDMRTISRNKKRLCLKVYEEAYKDVPL